MSSMQDNQEIFGRRQHVMFTLPEEILLEIFSYLQGYEVARLACTCRNFYRYIANHSYIWLHCVHNELTCHPRLLDEESYEMFYIRAYLGQVESLSSILCGNWLEPSVSVQVPSKIGNQGQETADVIHRNHAAGVRTSNLVSYASFPYMLEKHFNYKSYCNLYPKVSRTNLGMYFCHAARHNFEVWGRSLYKQGAPLAYVFYSEIKYYPIMIAYGEKNYKFIRALIKDAIDHCYSSSSSIISHLLGCQKKELLSVVQTSLYTQVLICISSNDALLRDFLLLADLPQVHQAAIANDISRLNCLLAAQTDKANILDTFDRTPVFYATLVGNVDCVQFLIEQGCKLEVVPRIHLKCLSMAISKGGIQVLEILRSQLRSTAEHDQFLNICAMVIIDALESPVQHKELLAYLIPELANFDLYKRLINLTATEGNISVVEALTSECCKLSTVVELNKDLIKRIEETRIQAFTYYFWECRPQCWKIILDRIPILHDVFQVPFDYGFGRAAQEYLKLNLHSDLQLFSYNKNVENSFELYYMLKTDRGYKSSDIVEKVSSFRFVKKLVSIIDNFRDIEVREEVIFSVFWQVMHMEWDVIRFRDAKANSTLRDFSLSYFNLLFDAGYHINDCEKNGNLTALHQAAAMDYVEWIKLFLQAGADRYLEDCDGKTAIDHVPGNSSVAKLLKSYQSCALPLGIDRESFLSDRYFYAR